MGRLKAASLVIRLVRSVLALVLMSVRPAKGNPS
jgi:hypothetical protein